MTILNAAADILSHGGLLAFPLALLAGVIAGLNPCCVALYPSAVAVCCGVNPATQEQSRMFRNSVALVFGVAVATTVLGMVAALAGRIVGQLGSGVRYAVAAVPLVMGLHLLGWVRLPINSLPHRATRRGWLGAFGAGLLLALALTPCGTPVLASVLSYVAYKGSIIFGATLLLLYGIGWSVPLVVVGTAAGQLTARLEKAGYGIWTERISGAALLTLGLFLVWRA
jgi:cytochrome c-type biogenesis protein